MTGKRITAILLLLAAAIPVAAGEFDLGAGFHFGSSGSGDVDANLALFEQAGLNAGRDERAWRFVEWNKGEIRYFKNNKIERMIDRLHRDGGIYINGLWYGSPFYDGGDYPRTPETIEAFCRYAEFVTAETRGKATYQQVWNEWDAGTGAPAARKDTADYEVYANLLKTVAPRIRSADPGVKIMSVSATMVFKLENMLKAGVQNHVDALAFHPYVNWRGPGNDTVEYWYGLMTEAGKVLDRYCHGKIPPVYLTELGWSTGMTKTGVSERVQSVYAAQTLLLVRSFPFVKGLLWYDFQDDGVNPLNNEMNFGLIRADGTPKPAYYAFADLSKLVREGRFIERVDAKDPKVVILKFQLGGRDVLAMWNWYANRNTEVVLRNHAASPGTVSIRNAGRRGVEIPWGRTDWLETRKRRDNELTFTLRDMPLLVEGDLAQTEIVSLRNIEFRRDPDNTPAPVPKPGMVY